MGRPKKGRRGRTVSLPETLWGKIAVFESGGRTYSAVIERMVEEIFVELRTGQREKLFEEPTMARPTKARA